MQMRKDGAPAAVNPNYKLHRILQNRNFAERIEADYGIDYSRQVVYHETHTHEHTICVYAPDSALAMNILEEILQQVDATFWCYNSSILELESDYSESAVKDYRWDNGDNGDNGEIHLSSIDTNRTSILCYDVAVGPHLDHLPSTRGWVMMLLRAMVIATIAASCITLFVDKLSQPCKQA